MVGSNGLTEWLNRVFTEPWPRVSDSTEWTDRTGLNYPTISEGNIKNNNNILTELSNRTKETNDPTN